MDRKSQSRSGFTLVELLVVIAIIGVLIALLLPAVQQAREAARRMSCSNKMKQLGLAVHNYHDTHRAFPFGSRGNELMGWNYAILPFIEQKALYDQGDATLEWDEGVNIDLQETKIEAYLCPSSPQEKADNDSSFYTTHYYGVAGPTGNVPGTSSEQYNEDTSGDHGGFSREGLFLHNRTKRFADITDGTSNTLAIGEISWTERNGATTRYRSWNRGGKSTSSQAYWIAATKNIANPINSDITDPFNDLAFGSHHPGGCQFLLGDASVRFLPETISYDVYLYAASIGRGETFSFE